MEELNMAKFNEKDIQNLGIVEVSASKLRALATKIEEVFKTAENVEVEMYIVPSGAKKTFAFDFKAKETPATPAPEAKPAEPATPPAEATPEAKPAEKPAEATPAPAETKPAETPKAGEAKPEEKK